MRTTRKADELRPLTMERDVVKHADGSVLVKLGDTHVICTAKVIDGVPPWRRGDAAGWLTAEYSMLPAATVERTPREAVRGRQGGRTHEIQRLIGRSLRAVVDFGVLGERTVHVDCDAIQADGGTRTAAVSGGYVALVLALQKLQQARAWDQLPLFEPIAAVSVGIVDGEPLLDFDYEEDAAAAVDMNVVVAGEDRIVEVQATAEGEPFTRATFDRLLDLAVRGCAAVRRVQDATLGRA